MDLEPRRMAALDFLLERGAEARNRRGAVVRAVDARAGIPELRAEPAQVVPLPAGAMVEPRHVDVLAADSAIVARFRSQERGEEPRHVHAHLLAEETPDHVGSVADAV